MNTKARAYTKKIFGNTNHFNKFGEEGDQYQNAEPNTEGYAKNAKRTHEIFIEIVKAAQYSLERGRVLKNPKPVDEKVLGTQNIDLL